MGVSAERRSSQGCRVGTGHLASGWSLKALTEHLLRARPFGGHDLNGSSPQSLSPKQSLGKLDALSPITAQVSG